MGIGTYEAYKGRQLEMDPNTLNTKYDESSRFVIKHVII